MHPITIIEIMMAVGIVLLLLLLVFIFLKKSRTLGLFIVLFVVLADLAFFAVRPFWIDYHIAIKIEQLDEYLENKYPGEEWEINRRIGRQYNPYHLEVRFENEKKWIYFYSVNGKKIRQIAVSVPDRQYHKNGLHYER